MKNIVTNNDQEHCQNSQYLKINQSIPSIHNIGTLIDFDSYHNIFHITLKKVISSMKNVELKNNVIHDKTAQHT